MTLHVVFLVEEPSMESLLDAVVPQLHPTLSYQVYTFNGKKNLLKNVPERLRSYSRIRQHQDLRVCVVVDRDSDDCVELAARMTRFARDAGLSVASVRNARPGGFIARIAVEELAAWLLGDVAALRQVYPRLSEKHVSGRRFRDPDAIGGGTWEALERVLQNAGYHQGGLPKVRVAQAVGPHLNLDPDRSSSASFRQFVSGLHLLVTGVA
ncbi:MAG: DUF4276 family protein [Dermatophilaceae bacterium]